MKHDVAAVSHVYSTGWKGPDIGNLERERDRWGKT